MKLLKLLGIIVAAVLLLSLGTATYFGLFSAVTIQEEQIAPQTILVIRHTGPYSTLGAKIKQLYKDLEDSCGIVPLSTVGIYYDNPQTTAQDQLRSFYGVPLNAEELFTVRSFDLPYETISLPPMKAYVASFPYKGVGSLFVAIAKVYPKLANYCTEQGFTINSPTLEITDIENETIKMVVPITLKPEQYQQWWTPTQTPSDTTAQEETAPDSISIDSNSLLLEVMDTLPPTDTSTQDTIAQ